MKKTTTQILQELYILDPTLKKQETSLIQLIEEIQTLRPQAKWDKIFYKTLQAQIRNEVPRTSLFSFSFMKKLTFATAVLLLIATPVVYKLITPVTITTDHTDNTVKTQYTALNPNAFGPLTNIGGSEGLGGGNENPPSGTLYTYAYNGDALTNLPTTLDVITPQTYTAEELKNFLTSKNLLDWYTDSNVNFNYGTMMLNSPEETTIGDEIFCEVPCPSSANFPATNILSDDAIIAIMNQFLTDHNLSTDSIGPMTQKPYISQREDGTYNGLATINYQFLVKGKNIVGMYGDTTVGALNIDMRTQQVLDFLSVAPEAYVTSAYTTADNNSILAAAGEGGLTLGNPDNATETVTLHLGTPTVAYVGMVDSAAQKTYYVPAYVFPIIDKPDNLDRSNVVVPLVQDMMDNLNQAY